LLQEIAEDEHYGYIAQELCEYTLDGYINTLLQRAPSKSPLDFATLYRLVCQLLKGLQVIVGSSKLKLIPYIKHYTLCITHSTLCITHFTLCITHSTLRITHSTLRITHSTLRITHSTLRITHSTLCITHSTLCITHSTLRVTYSVYYRCCIVGVSCYTEISDLPIS